MSVHVKVPPNPGDQLDKFLIRTVDLRTVWDCRCDLDELKNGIESIHSIFEACLTEEAKGYVCVLVSILTEKLQGCIDQLTQTIEGKEASHEDNRR